MKQITKRALCGLLLLVLLGGKAEGHGIAIPAVIDTDVALDDLRAIAMLFNSGVVDVSLIVASDGSLSPQAGAQRLKRLLYYIDREEISIAVGKSLGKSPPPWREWLRDVQLPEREHETEMTAEFPSAPEKIAETLQAAENGMLYVGLGPLTNLAAAIKTNPAITTKISSLVYFGNHPNVPFPGWNTTWDPESALTVFDSGLRIYSLCFPEGNFLPFNQSLYEEITGTGTSTGDLISAIHDQPTIKKLLAEGHFYVWDEMAAIYLNQPSLFTFIHSSENTGVMELSGFNSGKLRNAYLRLIGPPADMHLASGRTYKP